MVLPLKSNKSTKTLVGVGEIPDPPLWYKSGEQRHRLVSTQEPLNRNCISRMSHVSTSGAGEQVCLGKGSDSHEVLLFTHGKCLGMLGRKHRFPSRSWKRGSRLAGAWQTLVESQPRGPQGMKRSGDSRMLRSVAVTFPGRFHARGMADYSPNHGIFSNVRRSTSQKVMSTKPLLWFRYTHRVPCRLLSPRSSLSP